jgi:beta-D-galactosyl-(1->4)-L-rhamnose phosphorylase
VDWDTGARICHGKWKYEVQSAPFRINNNQIAPLRGLYLIDGKATVYLEEDGIPVLTSNDFGKGKGIYLSSFVKSPENTRLLLDIVLHCTGELAGQKYITDNPYTECDYFPAAQKLVVINNSDTGQSTAVQTDKGSISVFVEAYEMLCLDI